MAYTPAIAAQRYTPIANFPVPVAASAAPSPAYSGTFIPEIWSSKLIDKFYDATVLAAIANTDYEGEIQSYGDTINIRTRPNVTIKDYAPDMALEIERPSAPIIQLTITEGHYFNTILDDVYRVQSDLDMMNLWAVDAAEQMKITVDRNVLAALPTMAHADNIGATAGRISNDIDVGVTAAPRLVVAKGGVGANIDIIDYILNMGQVLDEQNVPENGRFIILPSWASTMLKKSELRDASLTGDAVSVLRNGRIGVIDRFTIYTSNLLPAPGAAGEQWVIAGTAAGLSFAAQLTEMETLRSEQTFGTLMRGLMVYGFGATLPISIAAGVIKKG
jgi:hypothetical protein